MARLVSVLRDEECNLARRQLPMVVDETLTMILQLNDTCLTCDQQKKLIPEKDLDKFHQMYDLLSRDELAVALLVDRKELFSMMAQIIPCVGCRRSAERLFHQLTVTGHPALEPLVITEGGILSVHRDVVKTPLSLCTLFNVQGPRLTCVIDGLAKSRKNRRCVLHSLDSQRSRPVGNWLDVWGLMSQECRDEVVLVEAELLLDTLETYLRKHRFCTECRSKVLRAYNILVGEVEPTKEKGYVPALYNGIHCCYSGRGSPTSRGPPHLHIQCTTDFIAQLVTRAEPELLGGDVCFSRRERHAKTIEIAQEEVLTCLGICLYERLHRIHQRLREEEQTWKILFCLGVESVKKNFQVAVEDKQGVTQLELLCEEISKEEEEEQAKLQRKAQKKQKKKRKKEKKQEEKENVCEEEDEEDCCKDCQGTSYLTKNFSIHHCPNCSQKDKTTCGRHKNAGKIHSCHQNSPAKNASSTHLAGQSGGSEEEDDHSPSSPSPSPLPPQKPLLASSRTSHHPTSVKPNIPVPAPLSLSTTSSCIQRDCGYSSSSCNNDTNSWSSPSSCESSDVACSEGFCNHDHDGECHDPDTEGQKVQKVTSKFGGMTLSLEEMLEEPGSSDENLEISAEEVKEFQSRLRNVTKKREELRRTLRERFDRLCNFPCRN